MGRGLIKIKDLYFEWSTVVDAPVSGGMTLDQLTEYTRFRQGQDGVDELPNRLKRIEQTGTSFYDDTLADLLACNRAGAGESHLSAEEIYQKFGPDK